MDLFDPNPLGVKPVDPGRSGYPLWPEKMPEGLYLGTSSWSFPGWDGLVYDGVYSEQRLADRGLEAYARCPLFSTVSLDKSYYQPPEEAEFARLARQVPGAFRFVVKAPRDLLACNADGFDADRLWSDFLDPASRGLGEKLGVVLL